MPAAPLQVNGGSCRLPSTADCGQYRRAVGVDEAALILLWCMDEDMREALMGQLKKRRDMHGRVGADDPRFQHGLGRGALFGDAPDLSWIGDLEQAIDGAAELPETG